MENDNPDQGAEQPEVENTEETVPAVEVSPDETQEEPAVEVAPDEPQPVYPEAPEVPEQRQPETEPFREAVDTAEGDDEALGVVTEAKGTRTFFGREYEVADNGALRQTSR